MTFERSTLQLRWDESTEWAGLEVEMERLSVGQLVEVGRLADQASQAARDNIAVIEAISERLADGLIGWNWTRRGQPVPTTVEGVKSADLDMLLAITNAWLDTATQVPAPLPERSNGGDASPPPLTVLADNSSPNPVSSPVPA